MREKFVSIILVMGILLIYIPNAIGGDTTENPIVLFTIPNLVKVTFCVGGGDFWLFMEPKTDFQIGEPVSLSLEIDSLGGSSQILANDTTFIISDNADNIIWEHSIGAIYGGGSGGSGTGVSWNQVDNSGNPIAPGMYKAGIIFTEPALDFPEDFSGVIPLTVMDITMPLPQGWSEDVRLTDNHTASHHPSIAVDSDNNVHVIWTERHYDPDTEKYFYRLYYTKLDRNGVKLVQDISLSGSPWSASLQSPKSIAIDSQDNVHIIWKAGRCVTDWVGFTDCFERLLYTKLDSLGNKLAEKILWSATYPGANEPHLLYPHIVVDSNDNLHVSLWEQASSIRYLKLDNEGNILAQKKSITCGRDPSICVDSQNNVFLAFFDASDVAVHLMKLDNEGNIVIDSTKVSNTLNRWEAQPRIATDSANNIHLVWQDTDVDSTWQLYYTKLDSGANTLVEDKVITNRTVVSDWDWIEDLSATIDSSDNIHITWPDNRDGNLEIYYLRIDNNGNPLGGETRLTTYGGSSESPSIAVASDNKVCVTWYDNRHGYSDIYYKYQSSWLAECDNYADLGNPADEARHNLNLDEEWDEIGTWYTSPSEDSTARCLYIGQNNYLTLCVPEPDVSYLLTAEVLDGECNDSFEIYVNGNQIYSHESNPETTVVKTHRAGVPAEYVTNSEVLINFKSTADDFGCPYAAFENGRAPVYNVNMVPLENCCELFSKPFPSSGKGIWITAIWKLGEAVQEIIDKLQSVGVKWVIIKCGNSNSYWLRQEGAMAIWLAQNGYSGFDEVISDFHDARIKVFGAQYVYSYDLYADFPENSESDVANMILDIPGIDGLIIDVECQYEEAPGPACPNWIDTGEAKSDIAISYMQAIRQNHPTSFIAYNTWGNPLSHPIPYREFGFYCDAVMPQAYWIDWATSPTSAINIMCQQWNQLYSNFSEEGKEGSIKPIIPMGQCTDQYGKNPCPGREIKEFCEAAEDSGYDSVSMFRYGRMGNNEPYKHWDAYTTCFNEILIKGYGPIDLIVTDSWGRRVGKVLNEIPGAAYLEYDIDEDGVLNDIVAILKRIIDTYLIEVIPDQGGLLSNYTQSLDMTGDVNETYSLELEIHGQTMILAEDVPIEDIPAEPYEFESKLRRTDFDTDGDVDFADYAIFANHWSEEDCNYPGWCEGTDLDYSGSIDFLDLDIFAENWLWEKIPADLDIDGDVDFADYVVFADRWMDDNCDAANDYCEGTDLDELGTVDIIDLGIFAESWLAGV